MSSSTTRPTSAPRASDQDAEGSRRPCARTRSATSAAARRSSSQPASPAATGPTRSSSQPGAAATASTIVRSPREVRTSPTYTAAEHAVGTLRRGLRAVAPHVPQRRHVAHHEPAADGVRGRRDVIVGHHGEVGAGGGAGGERDHDPGDQPGRPTGPGAVAQQGGVVLVHVGDQPATAHPGGDQGGGGHVGVEDEQHPSGGHATGRVSARRPRASRPPRAQVRTAAPRGPSASRPRPEHLARSDPRASRASTSRCSRASATSCPEVTTLTSTVRGPPW